jgi:hypothetical protein
MTRYMHDVKAAFTLVFESNAINMPIAGLANLLTSLDFVDICVVAPNGTVESRLPGLAQPSTAKVETTLLDELRRLAASGKGQPALSDLRHSTTGRPIFYLAVELPEHRLGLGVLSTEYLVSLQQAIAFGDHGHAVITDAKGRVIAHPFKDWVATSRDISSVPVVAAMMRGETGVGQFFSAAYKGDMIAGFSVVPETADLEPAIGMGGRQARCAAGCRRLLDLPQPYRTERPAGAAPPVLLGNLVVRTEQDRGQGTG